MRLVWLLLTCTACGLPDPIRCGLWEEAETYTVEADECLWIATGSDAAVTGGECPSEPEDCQTLMPGETARTWVQSGAHADGLHIFAPLDADGACPISCDWGGPCGESEQLPGECIPCPSGLRPAAGSPFACPE